MNHITVEIQTKADLALGKRIFDGFAEKLDKNGFVPGVVERIGVIEQSTPQEHAVLILIEVETGEDTPQTVPLVAQMPAIAFLKAACSVHKALEDFDPRNRADA